MAKRKIFADGHCDITNEISVKDLHELCGAIMLKEPNAIVTIRQCKGTDFPPFIAIESSEFMEEQDSEGNFPRLLLH